MQAKTALRASSRLPVNKSAIEGNNSETAQHSKIPYCILLYLLIFIMLLYCIDALEHQTGPNQLNLAENWKHTARTSAGCADLYI